MLPAKASRSLFAVILTCVIAWNGFATPAFAASDPVGSIINGFWGAIGAAMGSVATCYTVDLLIAPVAPPVAIYLAPICGAVGAAGGALGGAAGANAIAGAH
ncbi:MAG: hypothetical protein KME19_23640 [Microcoleus vaginatus WJT46-NPBG5]|jgi:hypothetical protein|nr:hypothetical protein [Microcoleus vaginatus WJT46-NPBG5]